MKLEDALARAERLRIRPEYASSRAELENAAHLKVILNALWEHWRTMLDDFGVRLLHWGSRGNAALGEGRFLFIQLENARWAVKRKERDRWMMIAGDWGMETLRDHFAAHPPRPRRFAAPPEVRRDGVSAISNHSLAHQRCS